MQRVLGIGGVFFQSPDAAALRAWYQRHLGIDVQAWGGTQFAPAPDAGTIWSVGDAAQAPFSPGRAAFMVNYRVADLAPLVQLLRDEGCQVLDASEDGPYGRFAWVIDPDGNKVELWEPPPGGGA